MSVTTEVSVGDFLKHKAANMCRWLKEEGCPVDVNLDTRTALELTGFAQELQRKYYAAILARDFEALLQEKETAPAQLTMLVGYVRGKPPLHDKFWRYLKLFSDTVS